MLSIEELPIPTMACIDGIALGGGLELALACDLRVATQHSIFGFPEVGLAVIPGAGGTQRLPRLIRPSFAKFLTFTAGKIEAPAALDVGLVDFVVGKNHGAALPHLLQKQVEHESLDEALEMLKRAKDDKFGTTHFRHVEITSELTDIPERTKSSKQFTSTTNVDQ